ncbi:hypothetical protein GWI33_006265 [Rhynchophorus ferrugineus]|uniref:Uncharacterized protein n=1 Tax=Rhynchophorus ferrugineus TaxID=354439 RepID=A0A834IG76_RHYFE|nr:hypothetical protein GWI33_006265 [Rhynchophorus ferrugineus]
MTYATIARRPPGQIFPERVFFVARRRLPAASRRGLSQEQRAGRGMREGESKTGNAEINRRRFFFVSLRVMRPTGKIYEDGSRDRDKPIMRLVKVSSRWKIGFYLVVAVKGMTRPI